MLKFGFIRSPTLSPLSAKQLLAQKAISPVAIDIYQKEILKAGSEAQRERWR